MRSGRSRTLVTCTIPSCESNFRYSQDDLEDEVAGGEAACADAGEGHSVAVAEVDDRLAEAVVGDAQGREIVLSVPKIRYAHWTTGETSG